MSLLSRVSRDLAVSESSHCLARVVIGTMHPNVANEESIPYFYKSCQRKCEATCLAEEVQYPGEGSSGTSESPAGAGEPIHGVREPAGQY